MFKSLIKCVIFLCITLYYFFSKPLIKITILSSGLVYSDLSILVLKEFKIPYKVCKVGSKITHYVTDIKEEIPFEGLPIEHYFGTHKFIPYTEQEISKIQDHTKLENLTQIQTEILSKFETLNLQSFKEKHQFLLNFKKLKDDLYFVSCERDQWFTNVFITDLTMPIMRGETLRSAIFKQCETEMNLILTNTHFAHSKFEIITLPIYAEHDYISSVFSLENCRTFRNDKNLTIHPFHFPCGVDPFLGVMILSLSAGRN